MSAGPGGAAERQGVGRGARPAPSPGLQWLRGAAALLVLLYHAAHYVEQQRGDARPLAVFDGRLGGFGVALFFAISGLLMAHLAREGDPAAFLARRLARILPTYWVVVGAYAVLHSGARFAKHLDPAGLALAPVGGRALYPLGVEWTLVFEVAFYAGLFALGVLRLAHRLEVLALAWAATIVVVAVLVPARPEQLLPTLAALPLQPACLAFALGLLAPWLLARRLVPPGAALVGLGLAALDPASWLHPGPARLVVGLAAALVVADLSRWRAGNALPPPLAPLGAALGRLGDASYALYLCHVPVVMLVLRASPLPGWWAWGAAVGAAVLVALPLGRLDAALHARCRARAEAMGARGRAVLVWGYLALFVALAAPGLARSLGG